MMSEIIITSGARYYSITDETATTSRQKTIEEIATDLLLAYFYQRLRYIETTKTRKGA
jgi:hypothetical protein